MNALKSLTFTTLPTQGANPILDRRAKVIARLEEQKLILKDPNYTRTNRKWVKKDGERVMVEQQQRVPLWWRQHPNGSLCVVRSERVEGNRVRKRQTRNRGVIARQIAVRDRHLDRRSPQWRTRSAVCGGKRADEVMKSKGKRAA